MTGGDGSEGREYTHRQSTSPFVCLLDPDTQVHTADGACNSSLNYWLGTLGRPGSERRRKQQRARSMASCRFHGVGRPLTVDKIALVIGHSSKSVS